MLTIFHISDIGAVFFKSGKLALNDVLWCPASFRTHFFLCKLRTYSMRRGVAKFSLSPLEVRNQHQTIRIDKLFDGTNRVRVRFVLRSKVTVDLRFVLKVVWKSHVKFALFRLIRFCPFYTHLQLTKQNEDGLVEKSPDYGLRLEVSHSSTARFVQKLWICEKIKPPTVVQI